jgi:uncharacterized surface anchored protein
MGRLLLVVTLAFVVSVVLAPSAVAQFVEEEKKGEPPLEEKMETPAEEKMEEAMEPVPEPPFAQEKQKAKAKEEKAKAKEMPKTGGPFVSVILPAGALLVVGSGVLAYTVVRRR